MSFYHGSTKLFKTISVLKAQPTGYTSNLTELELLFEENRPNNCISRKNAVFLATNPNDIENLGGYIDVIYLVEPLTDIISCDLAWYTKAEEYLEIEDYKKAKECALNYWNGIVYSEKQYSCIEVLCGKAKIKKVIEINEEESLLEII